jgi:hypothetical protein
MGKIKILYLSFTMSMLTSLFTKAQELFPYAEAATTMGKGFFAYRVSTEHYRDIQSNNKHWYAIRCMYGITSKWTVQLNASLSNHHITEFPQGFATYFLNHHTQFSSINPYSFEGFHGLVKYRFMSIDRERKHFRMASYFEASTSNKAHDEAEPNLMGDNAGFGAGIIATTLYKKLAVSLTAGYVNPLYYYDKKSEVRIRSGNMWLANFSVGYLLFPLKYRSYQDINLNLYCEFLYRDYDKTSLKQYSNFFDLSNFTAADPFTFSSYQANQHIDLRTSLQLVFNSISRIDVGVEWKFWKRSYVHSYPLLSIAYQRNIFGK